MVGFIIMKRGLCVSIVAPPSTTTSPRPVAERPECQSLPHKPLKAYLIFRSRLNGALLPRWHLQPNREPSCRVSESSLLLTLRWREVDSNHRFPATASSPNLDTIIVCGNGS